MRVMNLKGMVVKKMTTIVALLLTSTSSIEEL